MKRRRVLVVELNEITWDLIDPMIAQGKLPTFAFLKKSGTWGTPLSVDMPPQLDPWITWTTLHTGRPQSAHNIFFLQQPANTIGAKRSWEICADHGLTVGVYGSVCTWPPPKELKGFYVPDTFSQDSSTYPADLEPIQQLNLTYARSVRLPADQDTFGFKIKLGTKLMKLGLGPAVMTRIAGQLVAEKVNPKKRWQRVSLQPMVNFAFFEKLYREHQPDFATFHSNHVAHYQHTYWKAMQPDLFKPLETTELERETYGSAIEYGYRVADELLAKVVKLIDEDTVLVVASSMGQKPFLSKLEGGKQIQQLRSHAKLMEILGVVDHARVVSTMSDEFNIYGRDRSACDEIAASVNGAYIDTPERPLFKTEVMEDTVRVNLRFYSAKEVTGQSTIHFPLAPGAPKFKYEDLIYNTGHLKSGCHDPRGMVMFYGAGVAKGQEMGAYDNLDFAPTFLSMLGLPIPEEMTGRVMDEVATPEPAGVS